jgi:TonB family protein
VGYADTSGTDSYNMELSRKRTEAVLKWLVANKIATPARTAWKGETHVQYPYSGHENRRTEVIGFAKMMFPKKAEQLFIISNSRDTTIQGKEGTLINIPANVITMPEGQANGKLVVSLTEYYNASDILLNNLTTSTDTELLETNGMINLSILRNNEICTILSDRTIKVGFPVHGKRNENMRLFYGSPNLPGRFTWEEAEIPAGIEMLDQPEYAEVEEMPTFAGGDIYTFMGFANRQIKYPQYAIDNKICGRVIVGFTVDEKGLISDPRILRGAHSSLNAEALRAIAGSPPWKPGKQGNKTVSVQFVVPINFMMDGGCDYRVDSLGMKVGIYVRFNDSTFKDLGVREINYYVFESLSLGWLNCDQYAFRNRPTSSLRVRIEKAGDLSAHLLFMNYNSYLKGESQDGIFYFGQLPKNEEVVLFAVQKLENRIYWAHKKINTNDQAVHLDNFEEISFDDLNASIERLRKEIL